MQNRLIKPITVSRADSGAGVGLILFQAQLIKSIEDALVLRSVLADHCKSSVLLMISVIVGEHQCFDITCRTGLVVTKLQRCDAAMGRHI